MAPLAPSTAIFCPVTMRAVAPRPVATVKIEPSRVQAILIQQGGCRSSWGVGGTANLYGNAPSSSFDSLVIGLHSDTVGPGWARWAAGGVSRGWLARPRLRQLLATAIRGKDRGNRGQGRVHERVI